MEEQLIEKVTEEVKKNPSFRALLFINPMASTRDQAARLTTLGIKSIGKKQRRAKERQGEVARERGKGEESRRKGEKGAEYTHSLSLSLFFPFFRVICGTVVRESGGNEENVSRFPKWEEHAIIRGNRIHRARIRPSRYGHRVYPRMLFQDAELYSYL